MDETGAFSFLGYPIAGAAFQRLVSLTGAASNIDSRLLESVPWRKVNEFLMAVGMERSLEGLARRVLREIGALITFDHGFFTVVDQRVMKQPILFVDFRKASRIVSEYSDPSTSRGSTKWTHFVSDSTHDFLRRYGARHWIVLSNLKDAEDVGFAITLLRMTRLGFNDREMATCFSLRPHLDNLFSLVYAPPKARRSRLESALGACGFTDRERQIVLLLCDRLSAGEIAERMKISKRTVEKHIEHVYLKLRVHNRRGLSEETILAISSGRVRA